MAITVVNKKETAAAANTTLAITAPTAGNTIVMFINEAASILNAPKPKDNVSGETGWTVDTAEGHKAIYNTSLNSLWLATKEAVGGETTLEFTPGTGATGEGLMYAELSGASTTIDTIVHTDNGSGTAITSPSVTTTDVGDVILAAAAMTGSSGTVSAWTGTGPELTRVEEASTRVIGGYKVMTETLSAKTFTANWATSRKNCLLLVAFKPVTAEVILPPSIRSVRQALQRSAVK